MPSYSKQIVNYELLITNYRCESQKSLQRYRKITNSLLGITIFKDFKFRERELFWSLRSLGFPENYSRWPENLFQKIFIFKRKDAEIYFEHGKHKGHEKKLSKVREMELTLLGRNKNYSRWPENLFQKIKMIIHYDQIAPRRGKSS